MRKTRERVNYTLQYCLELYLSHVVCFKSLAHHELGLNYIYAKQKIKKVLIIKIPSWEKKLTMDRTYLIQ